MKRYSALFLLLAIACTSHDFSTAKTETALRRARAACPSGDLLWLENLLQKMQTDASQSGHLYMGNVDQGVYFVHQPVVMSCLGCVVFDCSGSRVTATPETAEKIMALISEDHLLYSHFPE